MNIEERIERLEKAVGIKDNERFEIYWNWILDKTTGLMWLSEPPNETYTWEEAKRICAEHYGARLPTIAEFVSLIDYSQSDPALPIEHPFKNVRSSYYWSATTSVRRIRSAWRIYMYYGYTHDYSKISEYYIWPVKERK